MPILIDGNNLLHTLPRNDRTREGVRRFVLDQTRFERITVSVVFDGPPPPGIGERESLGSITIVYSGTASADDIIVSCLPSGNRAKSWVVVTDDRELIRRVSEKGASVRTLQRWKRRKKRRPPIARPRPEAPLSKDEITEWQRYFDGEK